MAPTGAGVLPYTDHLSSRYENIIERETLQSPLKFVRYHLMSGCPNRMVLLEQNSILLIEIFDIIDVFSSICHLSSVL